jgi:hypothetical protein
VDRRLLISCDHFESRNPFVVLEVYTPYEEGFVEKRKEIGKGAARE